MLFASLIFRRLRFSLKFSILKSPNNKLTLQDAAMTTLNTSVCNAKKNKHGY